jgi:hypothetical protein
MSMHMHMNERLKELRQEIARLAQERGTDIKLGKGTWTVQNEMRVQKLREIMDEIKSLNERLGP